MILVVPYLWLSLYRSNLCKNECELNFIEKKILFQDTVSIFVSRLSMVLEWFLLVRVISL